MNYASGSCRTVTRRGVVTSVTDSVANIEIIQHGACSSCHIKALCGAVDTSRKLIPVPVRPGLEPGTTVDLSMDERFGWLGVLVGFVLPLVIVVGGFFALRGVAPSEEHAALLGVLALAPYFGLVYLFRARLDRVIEFEAAPVGLTRANLRIEEGGP